MHGMSIVDEIRDFNQRLSKAGEMFSVSSLNFVTTLWYYYEPQVLQDINTAQGMDEILQEIREIKTLRISQIVRCFLYKDSEIDIHGFSG